MIRDVSLEKGLIKEPVEYEGRVQRVFVMDSSGSSGDNWNGFMLISGDGEKCGGLCDAKVPLLVKFKVTDSIESQEYTFLK